MTEESLTTKRSGIPYLFALVLSCTTFPLIWVGGLVTTYDAGMAVPDWPTTYGYNMFLYPISTWVSGPWNLFIEHGHRLLGSVVGLLTIFLNVAIWKSDSRRWMRWVGAVALLLVISQGMLGGMRVQLSSTDFARAHGVTGPLFFASTIAICVMTSGFWKRNRQPNRSEVTPSRGHLVAGWVLTALAYCQLILGAHLRHPNVDWSPALFRAFVLFHIVVAFVLLAQALQVAMKSRRLEAGLRRPAWVLAFLVTSQLLLGLLTWRAKYGLPQFAAAAESVIDQPLEIAMHQAVAGQTIQNAGMLQVLTVTGHVALGSLILGACVFYATRLSRCYAECHVQEGKTADATNRKVLTAATSAMGGTTS